MKTTLLSAALIALAMPAYAADKNDIGGQCCSDLEERIAELEATAARKGTRNISLQVYGQVNRAIIWHRMDGESSTKLGVDNDLAPSRFGFTGQGKIGDAAAGFILEIGATDGDGGITLRESAVWVENAKLGRVWLGLTGTATYNVAAISIANVSTQTLKINPFVSTVGLTSDLPFNSGRTHVVKYVSPVMAGFIASAALSEDESWDVALRYAGEFSSFKLAAGIGYSHKADKQVVTSGSASIMHIPSGLFLNAAGGEVKDMPAGWNMLPVAVDSARMWHLQAGVEQKLSDLGKTTIYAEYGELRDITIMGSKLDERPLIYGVGLVQEVAPGASLYLNYRRLDMDTGWSEDKADMIIGGAVVKF